MDNRILLLSWGVFVVASLVMAWPGARAKGCMAYLVRMLGFLVGALSPLIVLWWSPLVGAMFTRWRFPDTLLLYLGVFLTPILGACAVTLMAAGWQLLLRRGKGDFFEKIDLSWFGLPDFSSNTTSNLDLDDCLGIALFVLLGGLFWLGLVVGSLIQERLVPRVKGVIGRALQAIVSLIYGLLVFGLSVGLLLFVTRDAVAALR